jgi:hypothetical protein
MRNCSLPTCSYTGLAPDVTLHEQDRHLIFPPSYRPPVSKKPDGVLMPGKGLGRELKTEEEVAAWIAERRKKWPTRDKVEEKARES